jgi:hypothetical protein
MECDCCSVTKESNSFKLRLHGNTKPSSICNECYLEATTSLDMQYLEHYKETVTSLRKKQMFKQCRNCEEVLDVSHFNKCGTQLARICKYCNREACELARHKKRTWRREDQHYKMPGGYGATPKQRLAALYANPTN